MYAALLIINDVKQQSLPAPTNVDAGVLRDLIHFAVWGSGNETVNKRRFAFCVSESPPLRLRLGYWAVPRVAANWIRTKVAGIGLIILA